jgi:hypothetical protein
MLYTNIEENYKISTLVNTTVGNSYSNTWTYTGKIYSDNTITHESCINEGEKNVTLNFYSNAPAGATPSGSMAQITAAGVTNYILPANTFTMSGGYTFAT